MDPNQPTPKLAVRLKRAMREGTGLRLSRAEARNVVRLQQIADVAEDLLNYLDRDLCHAEHTEGKALMLELLRLLDMRKRSFNG